MLSAVAMAGGRASSLMEQLGLAHSYIDGSIAQRVMAPDDSWEAYLRVASGDLDRPDWTVAGTGASARESERALKELAGTLAGYAVGVGGCMLRCLNGWERKAAGVVDRRAEIEESREWLRLVFRGWRELTDGVPAHAAAFEQRWQRGQATLAAQLAFPAGGGAAARLAATVEGSPLLALFGYMRLVRAGIVRAERRRQGAWLRMREGWGLSLARVHHEGHMPNTFSDWRELADLRERGRLERALGCTAGASAQLVRRKRRHKEQARADGVEELQRRAHAQRTRPRHTGVTLGDDGMPPAQPRQQQGGSSASEGVRGPFAAEDQRPAGGRKDDWALFFREPGREAMEMQLRCSRGQQLRGRLRHARRRRGEG